jgi:hypothetical protein
MHRSEPVAVDDVVAALLAGLRLELPEGAWWDLPGPEALSGTEILLRVAAVMGRKPVLMKIPLVTPRLSSHWIRLVTRADYAVARELVEGLACNLLATRTGYWDAAGLPPPMGLEEAAHLALVAEAGTLRRAGKVAEVAAGFLTRHAPARRPQGTRSEGCRAKQSQKSDCQPVEEDTPLTLASRGEYPGTTGSFKRAHVHASR